MFQKGQKVFRGDKVWHAPFPPDRLPPASSLPPDLSTSLSTSIPIHLVLMDGVFDADKCIVPPVTALVAPVAFASDIGKHNNVRQCTPGSKHFYLDPDASASGSWQIGLGCLAAAK